MKYIVKKFTTGGVDHCVVISHFGGKEVRGVAKRSPYDADSCVGVDLAQARCDVKIAEKRVRKSAENLKEIDNAIAILNKRREKALAYCNDANKDYIDAMTKLAELEEKVK